MSEDKTDRLKSVVLDGDSIGIGTPDQEHERQIAVYDLIEENEFGLPGKDAGPYDLTISLHEAKLMLDIAGADGGSGFELCGVERRAERIDDSQVAEAKVLQRTCRSTDILRVARAHQNNSEPAPSLRGQHDSIVGGHAHGE